MKNLINTIIITLLISVINTFGFGGGCRQLQINGNAKPCLNTPETYTINYASWEHGEIGSGIGWGLENYNTGSIGPTSTNSTLSLSPNGEGGYDNINLAMTPGETLLGEGQPLENIKAIFTNGQTNKVLVVAYGLGSPRGQCQTGGYENPATAELLIEIARPNYSIGAISGQSALNCAAADYYKDYIFSTTGNNQVTKYYWNIPVGWSAVYYIFGTRYTADVRQMSGSNLSSITITPNTANSTGILSVNADVSCGAKSETKSLTFTNSPTTNAVPVVTSQADPTGQCNEFLSASITPNTNLTGFIWSAPAVVDATNSANARIVNTGNTVVNVRAQYACGLGPIVQSTLPVRSTNLPSPTVNAPTQDYSSGSSVTRVSVDVSNLKSTSNIATGMYYEIYRANDNGVGLNPVPVLDKRYIGIPFSTNQITFSVFNFPSGSVFKKSDGTYYPFYKLKLLPIYGCTLKQTFTQADDLMFLIDRPTAITPPSPYGCYQNGSNNFVSSLSIDQTKAIGHIYDAQLRNTDDSPASSAKFAINNTASARTNAGSLTVNYNGQSQLKYCLRNESTTYPRVFRPSNYRCLDVNLPALPTSVALETSTTPLPIVNNGVYNFIVTPDNVNYSYSVVPKVTTNGAVRSILTSPTSINASLAVKAGNGASQGFTLVATNPLLPASCPTQSTATQTFDIVSDQTASTGGYMFDLYSTGMPYRGKIYIRVPAATDPNVNLGTARFNFTPIVGLSSQFTMEAWVQGKINSYNLPLYTIFSNWNSRTQVGFRFGVDPVSNKLVFSAFGNYHESNALPVGESFTTTNRCYHVAVVSNGTTITFYINGVAAGSSTINGTMNINNGDHYLIGTDTEETADQMGNLLPIANFVGVIREARLWNVSRTSNQINNFKSVKLTQSLQINDRTGLVSYLRLNEGTGATPADIAGDVFQPSNPYLNGIGLYYDYLPGTSPKSGSATTWSQATCSEIVFRKGAEEETTPLATINSQDEISIYPNPSSGMIEILVNDTFLNATLVVYDMQGKKVMAQTITDLQTKMDLSNNQPGMYFIKIGAKTFKLILAK